jgi:arabinofuranosyltransferase
MDRFARIRLVAGARLRELVPPDTWISVGAAGALPYASNLPAFDAYGLVDPSVLEHAEPDAGPRARPGHQLHAPLARVLAREPDLMCHIGWDAERPPTRADARRRAGPGWAWACVETGPIPDPHGETGTLDSRYYCCLRPRDRFEHLDPTGATRWPK